MQGRVGVHGPRYRLHAPSKSLTCMHHEGLAEINWLRLSWLRFSWLRLYWKPSGSGGTVHMHCSTMSRIKPWPAYGGILRAKSAALQAAAGPRRSLQRRSAHHHLGLHSLGLIGAVGDEGEAADALAVEAHVLGVRLRAAHEVAVLQEHPDRLGVPCAVPARKALHAKQH